MALLEVQNLQTHFLTPEGINRAVDGVSFHVDEGETLAIVGESGCGRWVTAMSLMRLIPEPPGKIAGSVRFQGKDLLQLSDREMRAIRGNDISMVFQQPMTSLNPVLTVGRQIGETLRMHQGLDRQAAEARAIEMLTLVGIPEPKRRVREYPHQLSGGMRQRVMIAIALACSPRLLIADEPTTAPPAITRPRRRPRHEGPVAPGQRPQEAFSGPRRPVQSQVQLGLCRGRRVLRGRAWRNPVSRG